MRSAHYMKRGEIEGRNENMMSRQRSRYTFIRALGLPFVARRLVLTTVDKASAKFTGKHARLTGSQDVGKCCAEMKASRWGLDVERRRYRQATGRTAPPNVNLQTRRMPHVKSDSRISFAHSGVHRRTDVRDSDDRSSPADPAISDCQSLGKRSGFRPQRALWATHALPDPC
jgi:hypothetical protein